MADKSEKNGQETAPAEEKRKGKGGSKGGQKAAAEKPPACDLYIIPVAYDFKKTLLVTICMW